MIQGLRQLDAGESFLSPNTLYRLLLETKMISILTGIDVVKWRHLFIHQKENQKGLNRNLFLEIFNSLSRTNTMIMGPDGLSEDEEAYLEGIIRVFDHRKTGLIQLKDLIVTLSRIHFGTIEDKLMQGFVFFDRYFSFFFFLRNF
mgnify:CR=1 FL=1